MTKYAIFKNDTKLVARKEFETVHDADLYCRKRAANTYGKGTYSAVELTRELRAKI